MGGDFAGNKVNLCRIGKGLPTVFQGRFPDVPIFLKELKN